VRGSGRELYLMRILALDPGQRRIGVALSDEEGSIALPLETIERKSKAQAVERIVAIVEEKGIETIVIGLPLRLDGTEGSSARASRGFGKALARSTEVPIVFWDERLTTAQADRVLTMTGRSARDRRDVVDQAAATVLLQGYLEATARRSERP
jgi:putative Holliday junction resolvase